MLPAWIRFIIAAASLRRWFGRINENCIICDRLSTIARYTYRRATLDARQNLHCPFCLSRFFAASCRRWRRGVPRNALAQFVPFANPRCLPRFWLCLSQSVRADAGEGRLSQGNVERCAFGEGRAKVLAKAVAWFDRDNGRAAGTVGRIVRQRRDQVRPRKWIASISPPISPNS
jgi:hypothetical protein